MGNLKDEVVKSTLMGVIIGTWISIHQGKQSF